MKAMRWKNRMILMILMTLTALVAMMPSVRVRSEVRFSKGGGGDESSIYVAGMPDCYPFEYYDRKTSEYRGIFPELLREAAESTGLSFVYLYSGAEDRRKGLMENDQVEFLFARGDEPELLENARLARELFTAEEEGRKVTYYYVFTRIAKESDITAAISAIGTLDADRSVSLFLASLDERFRIRYLPILWGLAAGLAVLLLLFLVLIAVRLGKRRKNRGKKLLDPVTGIASRKRFVSDYDRLLTDKLRELYAVACFGFDLDRAESRYGKKEAELLLKHVASVLRDRCSDRDFSARLSGGNFVMAYQAADREKACLKAEEVLRRLEEYHGQYRTKDGSPVFTAGVYSLGAGDRSADLAIGRAEQAQASAAGSGKRLAYAGKELLKTKEVQETMLEELRQTTDFKEFLPYIQFIVSGDGSRILGGELLSRWEHPKLGLLKPGQYVPVMTEMGRIAELDLCMIGHACRILERLKKEGSPLFISCNLSRITASDAEYCRRIAAFREQYDFLPEKLVLEVTEDTLERKKELTMANLRALKEQGFRIALDDFGSGSTSIPDLSEYPADVLKLDRKLLLLAEEKESGSALYAGLVRLSHGLGIPVIGEGAETEAQLRTVRRAGCDMIQGFCYSRPVPVREADSFFREFRLRQAERKQKEEDEMEWFREEAEQKNDRNQTENTCNAPSTENAADPSPRECREKVLEVRLGGYSMVLPSTIDPEAVSIMLKALLGGG